MFTRRMFQCFGITAAGLVASSALGAGYSVSVSSTNDCTHTGIVTVHLFASAPGVSTAAGGQFFLANHAGLTFFSATVPNGLQVVYQSHNDTNHTVDLAVGVTAPTQVIHDGDTIADIVFTYSGTFCDTANLVTFRSHTPSTQLTDNAAQPLSVTTTDLGSLSLGDVTAPVISCPGDALVNCDVDASNVLNTGGSAAATDNCGTVTVTHADSSPTVVAPGSLNGWSLFATTSGTNIAGGTGMADFVSGPGSPPLGTGSAHLNTGNDGSQSAQMRTNNWIGTRIDSITELGYSTFVTSNNGSQFPYLSIWVDTDSDGIADDRIFFEPPYSRAAAGNGNPTPQADPVLNTWQHWDALHGMWYADSLPGPGSNAKTLAQYLFTKPNATIVSAPASLGGIRVSVGFASVGNVFNAYVDDFRIVTSSASAQYNFEATAAAPPCVDHVINRTWRATDRCGNSSTCVQVITQRDLSAPSVSCPPNAAINSDAGTCGVTPASMVNFEAGGYSLLADGNGVSSPSSAQAFSGSNSARLFLPSGSADFAKIQAPLSGFTVANASGMFQTYVSPGSAPNLCPYMYFKVDANQNGIDDFDGSPTGDAFIILFVNGVSSVPQGRWFTQGINGNSIVHVVGNRTGLTSGQFSSSNGGGLLSALRNTTFSGGLKWGDLHLTAVRVGAGEWPGAGQFEAFVDDMVVARNLEIPASASDNCDPAPLITASPSLASSFPVGLDTITWTATDCAGNAATCGQQLTVNSSNTLAVTVELAGTSSTPVNAPFTRCITFNLYKSGACAFAATVNHDITFTNGISSNAIGSALIDVPCGSGPYTGITATDVHHTLRRNGVISPSGPNYVSNFTSARALQGGNINDDSYIDILDFGGFIGQFGSPQSASTTCGGGLNADFSGNGLVSTEDFLFIQAGFLDTRDADPCGGALAGDSPVSDISVADLVTGGLRSYAMADYNLDGRLNAADVAWVAQHGLPRCAADVNDDQVVDVSDIFSYLNIWFADHPKADMNNNQRTDVQDIFDYINAWFQGC